MTHSTHFIYDYMASAIWLRTIQIAREETCWCHYIGYSYRLAARVLLYALSHRQNSTYHSICYFKCGAWLEFVFISMGPPRGIDLMTHCTMSGRSVTELLLAARRNSFHFLKFFLKLNTRVTAPIQSVCRICHNDQLACCVSFCSVILVCLILPSSL